MKSVKQILQEKTLKLESVTPKTSVYVALETMARHNIGAVPVLDGDRLVGIFSERDYARKVSLAGKDSKATAVESVMTSKVLYVTPDQTVSQCLALMTEKRCRHLPVVDNGKLVGIVSIGDLVKEKMAEQEFIIGQLERYITT